MQNAVPMEVAHDYCAAVKKAGFPCIVQDEDKVAKSGNPSAAPTRASAGAAKAHQASQRDGTAGRALGGSTKVCVILLYTLCERTSRRTRQLCVMCPVHVCAQIGKKS